eukprot:30164_1
MCKEGCMANRFWGIIIGVANTAIMVGYFMGVVILELQCEENCYDGITLLVGVLAGPIFLYIVGYFLSWLAFAKGKGSSRGCNFCCVFFWSLILLALLGIMCYHAYEMILLQTYKYSDIYGGMVCGNVAWAAILCAFLCNVMPMSAKQGSGYGRADLNYEESASDSANPAAV